MEKMQWNNQIGARGRIGWLIFRIGGKLHRFMGEDIPGVVLIVREHEARAGKWTANYFDLMVADAAVAISGRDGFHSDTAISGLGASTWAMLANRLGVGLGEAKRFLREWRPTEAAHLDSIEAKLMALDASEEEVDGGGAEEIAFSFGTPTRRMVEAGYWEQPVTVYMPDGEVLATLPPEQYQRSGDHGRVSVLEAVHESGMKGGTWSLRIAAPTGAKVCLGTP